MTTVTQKLTLHLNGGSKFSELHYKIFADGEDTGMTRHVRTDGRPRYNTTADEIHCGDETLDLKSEGPGFDPIPWVLARIPKPMLVEDRTPPDSDQTTRNREG